MVTAMMVMVTHNDGTSVTYWVGADDAKQVARKLAKIMDDHLIVGE